MTGEEAPPPNCNKCIHFYVTWDPVFPKGCRQFGIKSRLLPSMLVQKNTGRRCPSFQKNPKIRD